MMIVDVTTHVLEAPLTIPFRWSFNRADIRQTVLVEITTDTGITGWGECFGPSRPIAAIIRSFKPILLGADALATELIWQTLYDRCRDQGQKGMPICAISGIDIALWDIKGKHFNAPVHQLMGGPLRTEVEAYATGMYRRDDGNPLEYLVEEALGYVAEGFRGVKLKIGFDVEGDVAIASAVRKAVGPDVKLMMDANHGYDVIDAIRMGRMVEDLDIRWFEEPVVPEDLAGYREVKAALKIPLSGGECDYTRYGFREILATRSMDIVQPDTCAAGGLSECKKIADMAVAHGIRYIPHVWGTGIGLSASMQLLAVLPHNPPGWNPTEPLLEFDRSEHPFRQAVLKQPLEHVKGIVQVPTGPGLGIEIDREGIRRFEVD
ncbi:MAG: mandelate racemase/muconate lactonizing enzyme family protein [Proteobacteria bacterium]|nr:mandelate racemase/muconate lactonizing enzyme family protein [Pseudomonadota bacterium]